MFPSSIFLAVVFLSACGGGRTPENLKELCSRIADTVCDRDDCNPAPNCVQGVNAACCSGESCDYQIHEFADIDACLDVFKNATCNQLQTDTYDDSVCLDAVGLSYRQYCEAAIAVDCEVCAPGDQACVDVAIQSCCDGFDDPILSCDDPGYFSALDLEQCRQALIADQCTSGTWPLECF